MGRHKRNFFRILSNMKNFYKLARPLLPFSRFLGAFVCLGAQAFSEDLLLFLLKWRVDFNSFKGVLFMKCVVLLDFIFFFAKSLIILLYFSFFFITPLVIFF